MEEAASLTAFVDPDKLGDDCKIDIGDISGAMAKQTQLFVFYASQSVRARRQWERWKNNLEILEAQLDSKFRKELIEDDVDSKGKTTTKKPTEPQIRAAIQNNALWKAASRRVIDAQQISRLADVAERAFEHRREMVKAIAADQARERDGPLRVMANQSATEKATALVERMKAKGSEPVSEEP